MSSLQRKFLSASAPRRRLRGGVWLLEHKHPPTHPPTRARTHTYPQVPTLLEELQGLLIRQARRTRNTDRFRDPNARLGITRLTSAPRFIPRSPPRPSLSYGRRSHLLPKQRPQEPLARRGARVAGVEHAPSSGTGRPGAVRAARRGGTS